VLRGECEKIYLIVNVTYVCEPVTSSEGVALACMRYSFPSFTAPLSSAICPPRRLSAAARRDPRARTPRSSTHSKVANRRSSAR